MTAHHWIVHFPVALLLAGATADLAGALVRDPAPRRWATPLLVLGAAAALLAFLTGQGALLMMPGGEAAGPALEAHTQWGGSGIWPIAAAGGLRLAWRRRLEGPHGWALLGVALVSALVAVLISSSGMGLAHP